jgi:predicted nuclease with TOPRIM domain
MKNQTQTLAAALRQLENDIESPDGLANAAIAEAAERLDELAAQVEVLQSKVSGLNKANSKLAQKDSEQGRINALECALTCLQFAVSLSDDEALKKVLNDTLVIHNELEDEGINPTQCLREIEAKAGRAGFVEGVRQMAENEIGWFGHDADSCANHYAERIRQGGE